MLGFMLGMYKSSKVNLAILIGAALVFAGSLWLVRSQTTVEDVDPKVYEQVVRRLTDFEGRPLPSRPAGA